MTNIAPHLVVFTSTREDVGSDGLPLAEQDVDRVATFVRHAADLDDMLRAEQARSARATSVLCASLAELREQLAALGTVLGADDHTTSVGDRDKESAR